MKNFTYLPFFIIVFLIVTLSWRDCFISQGYPLGLKTKKINEVKKTKERIGEKITYTIKLGKVTLGSAVYNHLSGEDLAGKFVTVVTFETQMATFRDLEKIYSDPQSFLPLRVERSISIWPFPEKIIEEYNQENFTLKIKKTKMGKQDQKLIKKNGFINNAVLLPFYVRNVSELKIGWILKAALPSQEFEIKLVSLEDVVVPAGTFKAYRFESAPKRFEIWVSADERRIPVKIKGSNGIGYTLLMKEYKGQE